MTSAPTIPIPKISNGSTTKRSAGRTLCWKLTAAGQWVKAFAPWAVRQAQGWFEMNSGSMVFTTRVVNDADLEKPAIEVFEVLGSDHTAPGEPFVGVLESMHPENQRNKQPADVYFLVEPPALGKLVDNFATFLTVHPTKIDVHMKRGVRKSRRQLVAR